MVSSISADYNKIELHMLETLPHTLDQTQQRAGGLSLLCDILDL